MVNIYKAGLALLTPVVIEDVLPVLRGRREQELGDAPAHGPSDPQASLRSHCGPDQVVLELTPVKHRAQSKEQ